MTKPNETTDAAPASFSTDGLAEIEAEETELKRMAESGYMLSDTDYCCDVVCREHAVRMLRGLLSANVEVRGASRLHGEASLSTAGLCSTVEAEK